MTGLTVKPAPVRKSVRVTGTPERAFAVFANRIANWWPATHTILKSPLADTIIEPRDGGRWYQVGEDGSQCDIGRVLAWQPPERLLLAWQLNADWAFDPELLTEVEVTFVAEGDGATRVDLEHRGLERMGAKAEETRARIDAPNGWSAILESFRSIANA